MQWASAHASAGVDQKIVQQAEALRGYGWDVEVRRVSLSRSPLRAILRSRREVGAAGNVAIILRNKVFLPLLLLDKMIWRSRLVVVWELPTPAKSLVREVLTAQYTAPLRILAASLTVFSVLLMSLRADICIQYAADWRLIELLGRGKTLRLRNGFPVSSVKVAQRVKTHAPDEVVLLSVAHTSRWHGLDRVVKGMAATDPSSPSNEAGVVHLDVVGQGPATKYLRGLVQQLGLQHRVCFWGELQGRELDDVFDRADLALGSLGLHRIGLQEAATLKVREYCARGVPFIYAYDDPDFDERFPYAMRVEASDSPLDIKAVVSFIRELRGSHPHYQAHMRAIAEESLSWTSKLEPLAERMVSLVRNRIAP